MKIDAAHRHCEDLAKRLADCTASLEQIFLDGGLTKPQAEDQDSAFAGLSGPKTEKHAASAVIADLDGFLGTDGDPRKLELALQIAKIGAQSRICFPGGAMLSQEELEHLRSENIKPDAAPGHLFYLVAQEQLLNTGQLSFSYDLNDGFQPVLRRNLQRELGEELGRQAADSIELRDVLPGQRSTILSTIGLPDTVKQQQIQTRLADQGVTAQNNRLAGIYTKVAEIAVAAQGDTQLLSSVSVETEEAEGVRSMTLQDLVRMAERTSADAAAYQDYRGRYGNPDNTDGIRNPSTTWAAELFVRWLQQQIANSDDYVWTPSQPEG